MEMALALASKVKLENEEQSIGAAAMEAIADRVARDIWRASRMAHNQSNGE